MAETHDIKRESIKLAWTPPWENGGVEMHRLSARCLCGEALEAKAERLSAAIEALTAAFTAHMQRSQGYGQPEPPEDGWC